MHALLVILAKELRQLRRDPKILPILFVAPVFQLVILGYAATTDVRRVELAVCDLDRSADSRRLVQRFEASTYFRVTARVDAPGALDRLMQDGAARVALTIPTGFAAERKAGRAGTVQLLADGSDAMAGTAALGYASGVLLAEGAGGGRPLVELRPLVLYNPDLASRNFMVPAVVSLILMVMTMMLTAMAIVRESEIGTLEQLLVTPLTPGQLILGKLIPYALVGLVEALSTLPVALFWFRVPLRGSLLTLFVLTVPFMLCTLGLGLLTSTISRTQQQAMMLTAFVFMMPQIYLSGFAFPIQNMPRGFQVATCFVPLRHYITILRGIFLKGVGIEVLWPQALALTGLGTGILLLARMRFRRRLA